MTNPIVVATAIHDHLFTSAMNEPLVSLSRNDGRDITAKDIIPIPRSITFSKATETHKNQ